MIKRIVKLTFQTDKLDEFKEVFEQSKAKIKACQGCHHVELLQGVKPNNIFFTFSIWDSEDDLNNYRHSTFFKETWTKTKALFSDKPEAWSVNYIDEG